VVVEVAAVAAAVAAVEVVAAAELSQPIRVK